MDFNINLHNCSPSGVDVPFETFVTGWPKVKNKDQGHAGSKCSPWTTILFQYSSCRRKKMLKIFDVMALILVLRELPT